jgi:hypothetical protein
MCSSQNARLEACGSLMIRNDVPRTLTMRHGPDLAYTKKMERPVKPDGKARRDQLPVTKYDASRDWI